MKNIKIRALKRLKRVQRDFQKCKGKAAARFQELIMEAQSYLMNLNNDNQLCMKLR